MTNEETLAILEEAVGLGETILIVRGEGAIAEVMGKHRYSCMDEWITIGREKGSHIHLRKADVAGTRYTDEFKGKPSNAGLEVLGEDGRVLLKISFRRTNPTRADDFDAAYAARVKDRLARFAAAAIA